MNDTTTTTEMRDKKVKNVASRQGVTEYIG